MGQLDQRMKPISRLDFAREAAATGLSGAPSMYPQSEKPQNLGWGGPFRITNQANKADHVLKDERGCKTQRFLQGGYGCPAPTPYPGDVDHVFLSTERLFLSSHLWMKT